MKLRKKIKPCHIHKRTEHSALWAQEAQPQPMPLLVCYHTPPPDRLRRPGSAQLARLGLSPAQLVSRSRILFWAARSLEAACSLVCSTCPESTEVGLACTTQGHLVKKRLGRSTDLISLWRILWSLRGRELTTRRPSCQPASPALCQRSAGYHLRCGTPD